MPSFPMLKEVWSDSKSVLNACTRAAKASALPDRYFRFDTGAGVVRCHAEGCDKALMRLKRINEGQGWMIASTLGTAAILDHLERDYLREQNSLKLSCGNQFIVVRAGDQLLTFSELKLFEVTLEAHAMRTGLALDMTIGGLSIRESKTRICYRCQDPTCRYGVVISWDWSDDATFTIERMEMLHTCLKSRIKVQAHRGPGLLIKPLIRMKWTTAAEDEVNERVNTTTSTAPPSLSLGPSSTPSTTAPVFSPLTMTPFPETAIQKPILTSEISTKATAQRHVKRKRSSEDTSSTSPRPTPTTTPPTSRDTPLLGESIDRPVKNDRRHQNPPASARLERRNASTAVAIQPPAPTRKSARLAEKQSARQRRDRAEPSQVQVRGFCRTAQWVQRHRRPS